MGSFLFSVVATDNDEIAYQNTLTEYPLDKVLNICIKEVDDHLAKTNTSLDNLGDTEIAVTIPISFVAIGYPKRDKYILE